MGLRYIDPVNTRAVIASTSYAFSDKYQISYATSYDFGEKQNLGNSLIISRVGVMANIADEISKGNFEIGEFDEEGKDEVAQLSSSFNRMRRSLVKAMEMFHKQTGA